MPNGVMFSTLSKMPLPCFNDLIFAVLDDLLDLAQLAGRVAFFDCMIALSRFALLYPTD